PKSRRGAACSQCCHRSWHHWETAEQSRSQPTANTNPRSGARRWRAERVVHSPPKSTLNKGEPGATMDTNPQVIPVEIEVWSSYSAGSQVGSEALASEGRRGLGTARSGPLRSSLDTFDVDRYRAPLPVGRRVNGVDGERQGADDLQIA